MRKLACLLFAVIVSAFASASASAQTCNDPSGFIKTLGPITAGHTLALANDCIHAVDGGPSSLSVPASSVLFTQSGTGAQQITFDNIFRASWVTPEMYKANGSTCDGTDDSVAIQAAMTYAQTLGTGGRVRFRACVYKIVTGLVNSGFGLTIAGDSMFGTWFDCEIPGGGICYRVRNAGQIVAYGAIENIHFFTSDTTNTKTAIELEDISNYRITNIVVSSSNPNGFWSGGVAGSFGISTRGREFLRVTNAQIFADNPIIIHANPNSSISSDFFDFKNLYLAANAHPNFNIESGANVTRLNVDNMSCVIGNYCVFNLDTTSSGFSGGWTFNNVGIEQGTDSTAYNYYINHNNVIQGINIGGFQLWDNARNGGLFSAVRGLNLANVFYQGIAPLNCLSVDATVSDLQWKDSFFTNCSTAGFGGQVKVWSSNIVTGVVLPTTAQWAKTGDDPTFLVTALQFSASGAPTQLIKGQVGAGTPTLLLPNSAGTITVGANSPLTFDAVNGKVGWDQAAANAYSPTVTCGGGAPGSFTATGRYKQWGKMVYVNAFISAFTIGTCTGNMRINTPITGITQLQALSMFDSASAATGSAVVAPDGLTIRMFSAAGAFPTGFLPVVSGWYEIP